MLQCWKREQQSVRTVILAEKFAEVPRLDHKSSPVACFRCAFALACDACPGSLLNHPCQSPSRPMLLPLIPGLPPMSHDLLARSTVSKDQQLGVTLEKQAAYKVVRFITWASSRRR